MGFELYLEKKINLKKVITLKQFEPSGFSF